MLQFTTGKLTLDPLSQSNAAHGPGTCSGHIAIRASRDCPAARTTSRTAADGEGAVGDRRGTRVSSRRAEMQSQRTPGLDRYEVMAGILLVAAVGRCFLDRAVRVKARTEVEPKNHDGKRHPMSAYWLVDPGFVGLSLLASQTRAVEQPTSRSSSRNIVQGKSS